MRSLSVARLHCPYVNIIVILGAPSCLKSFKLEAMELYLVCSNNATVKAYIESSSLRDEP